MSDLASLTGCLVDSDTESLARARRLRRKTLAASLSLEGALIGAMLLVPLVTPGVLPRQFIETPMPPFHGGSAGASHPHQAPHPPRPGTWQQPVCLFCPPRVNHPHADDSANLQPPDVDGGAGPDSGGGAGFTGAGPFLEGGTGSGKAPIEKPRDEASKQPPLVHKSEGVMEAMLIHKVQPVYPPLALAAHLPGEVLLHAIIARDGTIRDLEVVSGNPLFAQSARAAVREWRYRPTLLNNQPVEVETYITVKFVVQ
jgi:protein TonB